MMEGSSFEGDSEFSSPQTLVVVGRKGNGKSATGNSILGTNMFRSERSSSGVTTTCEMNSTKLKNGRMINVIDTPGIFGSSVDTDFTPKEFIKCINMAGDGIHAFLLVFSIRNRFSTEEVAAISSLRLRAFFGRKIYNYMILVFTGGDQLDEDDETLEDFLHDCPEKLKEILSLCGNRCVLFNNKTTDQTKRLDQVEKLSSIVKMVSKKNSGKPYNKEMFTEWKALKEPNSMHEGHFKQIFEMAEEHPPRRMGGCSCQNEYKFFPHRTLVLVGKTGNGKSSTGNSIIGRKALLSKRSSSGVTVSSELQKTTLENGQMINVLDTPGLFDPSLDYEFIGKEIVKCINMAQDGVDAFVVVISNLIRFSEEERAAISCLQTLFGKRVYDYMIVVFTGGDELQDDNQTLKDFLCGSPESLKEILSLCGNHYVLFDNKTKDEAKRSNQLKKLLFLVNEVSTNNGGKPYTNEFFTEMKNQTKELKEEKISLDDERFRHIREMVDSKLNEIRQINLKLEQQLAEQRAACVEAEKKAKAAPKKSDDGKRKLKEELVQAEKKTKEVQQRREEEWRQQLAEQRAACVEAEKKAKAAQKKLDDEKRKLKEKLTQAEKKTKEEQQQREEVRGRNESWGCFIL